MNKKIKIGLVVAIVVMAIGLISIKKGSKTNVTLVGMIHHTKSMEKVLLICEARTLQEADLACKNIPQNDEVNNLCKLRLDLTMTKFNNKCLRYYKLVERIRHSQDKVSEFLKSHNHDHIVYESASPLRMKGFDVILKNCEDPSRRPTCMLETSAFYIDGWFKEKYVDYIFEEESIKAFIKIYPNYEEDIMICKDYQIEEKCKVMNDFMKLYSEATQHFLSRTHGKNVIVIMGQEQMNYVSCKNFNSNRYNCKDLIL